MIRYGLAFLFGLGLALIGSAQAHAQAQADDKPKPPREENFYQILAYSTPPGEVLEIGAIEEMPDGRVAVATRRGDIWMIANSLAAKPEEATFKLWARGLHEVLGLAYNPKDQALYVVQRCEVSRVKDTNNDDKADLFETVSDEWGITGDYHEYAFGSKFDKDGNLWLVFCLTGSFTSETKYRGWCVRVSPDGKLIPTCSGIRSPAGIGVNLEGEMFYTDNQGPWNGCSSLKHLVPGSFQGHPGGNRWYAEPSAAKFMGARPPDPQDRSRFHVEAAKIKEYVPPPVLLPHDKVGKSASGIAVDAANGKFGPFAGQLFVSDQSHSVINRVDLEKVKGRYQGACIPFREGFGSGNVPMHQAKDGSMLVGGTNRGWGSRGRKDFAIERLVWTGRTPFEIHRMRVQPDGFELTFTAPVDRESAAKPESYNLKTYTYAFRAEYGGPEVDHTTPKIAMAKVSDDGLKVKLTIEGLQIGHIHELTLPGVKSAGEGWPLLHPIAYYTLWNLP